MGECFDAAGRLAEFQIRVAAQGAQAAAWCVHQHAVDLAGQAFYLEVVLVRDEHRLDVAGTGAFQTRLEIGETFFRNVHCIQAALRIHHGGQHQRLAARTGTKIHHHVVAPGREQEAEQLAAFVLHFYLALGEQRVAIERDLFFEADADGRVGRGACLLYTSTI